MTVLMVEELHAGYGPTDVLRGVGLEVPENEVVTLLGRNGVGKTTLLKAVMGVLPARGGHVSLFGGDVTSWAPHRVARKGVAYAPQDAGLFTELTVRENLALAQRVRKDIRPLLERVLSWFSVLGQRLSQKAGTLSGGEQKMLVVARALLQEPRLLLLDEVTEGVQPSIVEQIGRAIEAERSRGATILLVEQRVGFALGLASRYYVMQRGAVVAEGRVTPGTGPAIEGYLVL